MPKKNDKDANQDRYQQTWLAASYLESEWSDILFPGFASESSPNDTLNPLTDRARPEFYKQIGRLAGKRLKEKGLKPKRYCDIGGSTGRTLYEIDKSVSSLTELVLVEPSEVFCGWAKRLLVEPESLGWIPTVGQWTKPSYKKAADPHEPVKKDLHIYEAYAETVPRPPLYFDLITCLNVVDRHKDPRALVETLFGLLNHNGLLILSSPMEFEEEFTPDKNRWITDLKSLFSNPEWEFVCEENIFYDFRYFVRKFIRYCSQVVVYKKRITE